SATACATSSIPGCAAAAPRAMPELLSVRGLSVDFITDGGVAQVLDGISLDIGPGEVVGLVGESGCGKTPLAQAPAGTRLAIGPGEVVGLVGESGCGKTTLARAILGILPAGPARVRGGEVRFRSEERRVGKECRSR